jgi:two-component system response regulator DevR
MKAVRVVLVDDHGIVRQGIRSILGPDPNFMVVGEAANGPDALKLVREQKPDIVLLDLKLPGMGGLEVCHRIVAEHPDTIVLMLTAFLEPDLVNACLHAGAKGYLLKDAERLNLGRQLLQAMEGHSPMDLRAVDAMADLVSGREVSQEELNARELTVLRHIAGGLTNKEIAAELHLSENTVKWYVQEILTKLDVRNRVQAALLAKELHLL